MELSTKLQRPLNTKVRKLEDRYTYYTDSNGVKHKIKLLKTTLSFPKMKEEEIEALRKEVKELEEKGEL